MSDRFDFFGFMVSGRRGFSFLNNQVRGGAGGDFVVVRGAGEFGDAGGEENRGAGGFEEGTPIHGDAGAWNVRGNVQCAGCGGG